jgi:surface polysaccharide O-acyltransferase-like enzyme
MRRFRINGYIISWIVKLTPGWSIPWWIFYFSFGALTALNVKKTKEFLIRYRWYLASLFVISWLFNILETDFWLQKYRTDWTAGVDTLSYHVFSLSALMCFLAFENVEPPRSHVFKKLSKHSYGIYLLHPLIIETIARVIRRFTPWLLAYQWVLVPLLFAAGLGIPILAMAAVKKWSPESKVYRYLFG